ncbi:hypothetical protein FQA39_LY11264 [Lamprigera yunnana]|nr:hypothetical protein FQA39_LY11264 [Lamprigera yunnana]
MKKSKHRMALLKVCCAVLLLVSVTNGFEEPRQEKIPPSYRKERLASLVKKKRSPQSLFSPWTPPYLTTVIRVPIKPSASWWQPQVSSIKRPYYIPVWGSQGQLPIYFPPQPIYTNPGYPADNPPNNAYLPPEPTDNSTVSTINKFEGDDRDRPVWGMSSNESSSAVKPTRRPRPSNANAVTHPPIIRDDHGVAERVTTTTTSMPVPEEVAPPPSNDNLPSRCVWAIISCCSASSNAVSYDCFEQLGCNGAFWDDSPCDNDIARAAISNVMNYYQAI